MRMRMILFIYYGQKWFMPTEKSAFSTAGSFLSPVEGLGIPGFLPEI